MTFDAKVEQHTPHIPSPPPSPTQTTNHGLNPRASSPRDNLVIVQSVNTYGETSKYVVMNIAPALNMLEVRIP